MELVRERVRQEVVEHIIVLRVPGRRVHVDDRVCPGVVQGYLAVMSEQVPCCAVVDRHGDEPVPVEAPCAVAYAGQEDCQVVRFSIELGLEGSDRFVV